MPYLLTSTRYTPRGGHVTIINDTHHPVMLVVNDDGDTHSVRVEFFSDEPVVDYVVEVVEEFNLFNQK